MAAITSATIYAAGYIRPASKCGCGLVLEAQAPGFHLDREIGQQLDHSSAIQADLHAAIAGLASLVSRRLPVRLVVGNQAVAKLLEREGGAYTATIKNNEQLSRRLRLLAEAYPQLEVSVDKGAQQVQKAAEVAKLAAHNGAIDTGTKYTKR